MTAGSLLAESLAQISHFYSLLKRTLYACTLTFPPLGTAGMESRWWDCWRRVRGPSKSLLLWLMGEDKKSACTPFAFFRAPCKSHLPAQLMPPPFSTSFLQVCFNTLFMSCITAILSRLHTQCGAQCGTWTHDTEIKTWAEIESWMLNWLSHPGAPVWFFFNFV